MASKASSSAKRSDLVLVVFLMAAGYGLSILLASPLFGKALLSCTLIAGPSIAYLLWQHQNLLKKLTLSTLIFGGLLGFGFEFVQEFNKSYSVVSRIFPKIFNVVPLDNVLGHMLMALLTLVFYEHFISERNSPRISPRVRYAVITFTALVALEIFLYFVFPDWLIYSYSYAWLGAIAILPLFLYIFMRPREAGKIMSVIPFFFLLYLATEILAVKYRWWIYPSAHYVGHVQLFDLTFPFEELFFWMLFYAPAIISYYKIFIDTE